MDRAEFESEVEVLSRMWGVWYRVVGNPNPVSPWAKLTESMRYQEKSFTLPASQGITQEAWDAIWSSPKQTPSETGRPKCKDCNAEWYSVHHWATCEAEPKGPPTCPNCHCAIDSLRHEETCCTGDWFEYENVLARPEESL